MNPNITGIIGGIASILGIGTSLVSQGANIHRQLNMPVPQQQAQQQQCLLPNRKLGKLVVVLTANGQRQLACVEEDK
jgi:hypothetical protein